MMRNAKGVVLDLVSVVATIVRRSSPSRGLVTAVLLLLTGPSMLAIQPAAAAPARYPGLFDIATKDVGTFWAGQFAASGLTYSEPGVRLFDKTVASGCGPMETSLVGAYCEADRTIYLSAPYGQSVINTTGDFAWVVIVAHEWGHHVQNLLSIEPGPGPDFELQADCLAGAYAMDAAARSMLNEGDLMEAVEISGESGDPPWLPKDGFGAHGTNEQRVEWLMKGKITGAAGCGVPLVGGSGTMTQTQTVPAPQVAAPGAVPAAIYLPQAQIFRVEQQGAEAPDATLAQFGWTSGEFRIFASDNPPPGAAGWVEIHRHHFSSVGGASQALASAAQGRMAANGLAPLGPAGIGDESVAMSGPAYNGAEYTVYVRYGADLIRVTGISPSGVPSQDVISAAMQALAS